MADKNIVAVLKLDSKDFSKNISETQKDVLKFSAAVTGAGAAILAAVKISANWQDTMIKTSRQAGVSSETFSAYAHAAELSGVNTEQLSKAFVKLNNITPDAAKKLTAMGVNVRDVNGELKDSETLMGDMADAMKNAKSPADQAKIAFTAFGEEGGKMVNMLAGGREGLKNMTDEAERFGLVVSTQAGQNAEQFNDSIAKIGMSVKGFTSTFSETVIELINGSGVMDAISSTIADMTQAWRGLDADTKNMIVTIGGVVVAGAALAAMFVGIQLAIVPLVAAFSPVALAVAAIVVAFSAAVYGVRKYWDDLQDIFAPVQTFFSGIVVKMESFAEGVKNLFAKFLPEISSTGSEIDKFGTTVKTVIAGISIGAIVIGGVFSTIGTIVSGVIENLYESAQAIGYLMIGDFDAAVAHATKAGASLKQTIQGVSGTVQDAKHSIEEILSRDMTVNVDSSKVDDLAKTADKAKNSIDQLGLSAKQFTPATSDLAEAWKRLGEANAEFANKADPANQVLIAQANFAGKVVGVIGQATAQISKLADITASKMGRAQEILNQQLDTLGKVYDKFFTSQLDAATKAEDARIEALATKYDDEIAALQQQEARKNAAILSASNERKLIFNQEYQDAKAAKEAEFQTFLELEMQKYEAQKAFLLSQVADKEQAQLVETELEEGYRQYLAQLEQQHNEEMAQLSGEFSNKQKEEDAQTKEELKVAQEEANKTATQLEQEKSDALTKAEEQKQKRLNQMQEENDKRKEIMDRLRAQKQYQAEMAMYNTTKFAKVAEITVNTAAASLAAIASMAAIPIVGVPLGLAMSALITAAGASAIGRVLSSPPIPPPVLEKGGWMGGNYSHANGGIQAEIESNEFTIDKIRSRKMYAGIDSIINGKNGGGFTFNFYEGAIQVSNMDNEEAAREFSRIIGQELRRQGVVA